MKFAITTKSGYSIVKDFKNYYEAEGYARKKLASVASSS